MSATGMQPQGLYGRGDRGERGGDAGGGRNNQDCGGRQVRRPARARRRVASHQPRRYVHHASGYDALVQGRGGTIPLYRGAGPVTQRARSRHGNAPTPDQVGGKLSRAGGEEFSRSSPTRGRGWNSERSSG